MKHFLHLYMLCQGFRHAALRRARTNTSGPRRRKFSRARSRFFPPLCSGSRVKYFLHRQSALSAALFIAQAETAELTAVMSLALMECFVPPCVRARARATCLPRRAARAKLDAGAKMADRRTGEKRRSASDRLERIQFSAPRRRSGVLPLRSDVIKTHRRFLMRRGRQAAAARAASPSVFSVCRSGRMYDTHIYF